MGWLKLLYSGSGAHLASMTASNGIIVSGSINLTGSLLVTGSITGSLLGTASYATNALTASYVMNSVAGSAFPYTGSALITGSLIVTGSTILSGSVNVPMGITGSLSGTSSWAQNYIIPIGSMRGDFGNNTTVKSFFDSLFTYTKGTWLRNGAATTTIAVISANYPSITKDTDNNSIQSRTHLWLASSNYGFVRPNSTCIQTTSDFSTYTNREAEIDTIVTTTPAAHYSIDYDGSKVIRLGLGTSTSNASYIGYSYSTDGTTFNSVYGLVVSGVYTVLSNPCISGSTYSFWSSLDNARIYTTDHTNWTVCTNSINSPVHKMANGTLYCLTASSTAFKYSTDNGQTWTSGTLPDNMPNVFHHSIDYNGTKYVYVLGATGYYHSTDLSSWTFALHTASKDQVWYLNGNFIATTVNNNNKIETSSDGTSWTERTLANSTIKSYVLFAHSKYFVLGSDRVQSSSDLATWTSEIASGITAVSVNSLPQTFACASGNNLVFISNGVINIYQSGSWTAVTNAQQNTGLACILLGATNLFFKVR